MVFHLLRQPINGLEHHLCEKASELVNDKSDVMNVLDLFVALNIYKLKLSAGDSVQINLYKEGRQRGLRIFHLNGGGNTALVLE